MKKILFAKNPFIVLLLMLMWLTLPLAAQQTKKKSSSTKKSTSTAKSIYDFGETPDGRLLNLYIDQFITLRHEGKAGTEALEKMNAIFKEVDDYAGFMNLINRRYNECSAEKQLDDVVRYIDLYCFFAKRTDSRLPDLYEREGDLFAMLPFDSLRIHKCIKRLNDYETLTGQDQGLRIEKLNNHLEYIRNYVPLYCDINGIWIMPRLGTLVKQDGSVASKTQVTLSDLLAGQTMMEGAPYIMIEVANGAKNRNPTISLMQTCHFAKVAKMEGDNAFAQRLEDIGEDATYMAFSNEQLHIPNEAAVGMTTDVVGDIGNSLMSRMTNGMSQALGSGAGTGIISSLMSGFLDMGLNALQKKLSAPFKRVDLAELQLRRFNPNELCGEIHVQTITVKGEEQPVNSKFDYTDEVLLRWKEGDGIYFIDPTSGQPLTPSQPHPLPAEEFKKVAKDPNWFFRSDNAFLRKQTHASISRAQALIRAYNMHMMSKLLYITEQEAMATGLPIPGVHAAKMTVAYVGIQMEKLAPDSKEMQKNPNLKGVKVVAIDHDSPALLFGLEKGDIITAVDGFEFTTPEEVIDYIQSTRPFESIKFTILDGKKTKEISVVSSFIYI